MGRLYTVVQYLNHLVNAKKWDAFHSPFLFKLFSYCCQDKNPDPRFEAIEQERKQFLRSKESVNRLDFGAGPLRGSLRHQQRISDIARHALSRPFQCRFLSRLAQMVHPHTILEFGTSLGISAAYLCIGAKNAQILTVEGDPEIASRARHMFTRLGYTQICVFESSFEHFILKNLDASLRIDLLFLDGNHRAAALLEYYNALSPFLHSESIVIVDDIYWSVDMQDGWRQLQGMPEVTQSTDCFHFGLLFFKKGFLEKEHHRVRLPWASLR